MENKKSNNIAVIGYVSTAVRQNEDYYATEPKALEIWPKRYDFKNVWEPAVGGGHLAKIFSEDGNLAKVSDIIDRNFPNTEIIDFLKFEGTWNGDIVTNPPFKMASQFLEKAISVVNPGAKIALFLPIRYLEGIARYEVMKNHPPKEIWVSVRRLTCARNGDPKEFAKGSATAYAWFVWEKGFTGKPEINWFNYEK